MEHYDYLIVGGGVAGTTAAEAIRGRDPSTSIAILSDEAHPLYSRVLLPNYVKELIPRDQVFLRTLEQYAEKRIRLWIGRSARSLDPAGRTVTLDSGERLGFGTLLVASGGRPRPLGVPGEDLPGVSRFQTIGDADRMRELLPASRRAVVVGGSFIALEYLDILSKRGIPTTLVIPQPYFFSRFLDAAGGGLLGENFRRHGIVLISGERLAAIEGGGSVRRVRLAGGRAIPCDFVAAGIGLDRNTAWLGSSGIELTPHGVFTDEFLETTLAGVFAAGDAADFFDLTLGFRHTHGNWGNAFRQGDRAGRNMAGERAPYRAVSGYGIRSLGFSIALLGHVAGGPEIEAVSRLDSDRLTYGRFFLRGGRLVGAALINRPEDRSAVTALLSNAVPLGSGAQAALADPGVDIATLVP